MFSNKEKIKLTTNSFFNLMQLSEIEILNNISNENINSNHSTVEYCPFLILNEFCALKNSLDIGNEITHFCCTFSKRMFNEKRENVIKTLQNIKYESCLNYKLSKIKTTEYFILL